MTDLAGQDENTPAGRPARPRYVRAAGIAVVVVALAGIGWQVIANTAADTLARSNATAALGWRPDSSAALAELALEQLPAAAGNGGDLAGVESLAMRAMVADPLDADAFRLLGLVADVKGDDARASALMGVAGARSRRNSGTDLWLFDEGARQQDFAKSLANADAILRTQPNREAQLFHALVAVASDPAGQAAMLAMLATDPPWRGWFFDALPGDAAGPPIAYALLTGLAGTAVRPRPEELDPYLEAVLADGDYQLAFLAWLRFLPPDQAKSVPFVYDGDFEQPVLGLPFDWQFPPIRGAVTEVVDTGEKGIGKALRVVFSGTRVMYHHADKLMVLPPGTYELSGMAKADSLVTARGMRWRVACVEGANAQLAESDAFVGTFAWRSFAVDFTVPATGCRAQSLRLELDWRSALDTQATGTLWSDGLSVSRLDGAAVSN